MLSLVIFCAPHMKNDRHSCMILSNDMLWIILYGEVKPFPADKGAGLAFVEKTFLIDF